MPHGPFDIRQEDKSRNLNLHPILVGLGGEDFVLEHVEDLGAEGFENEVDCDCVDLKVEDWRDGDTVKVGRVALEAGRKAEGFLAAETPGVFNEAAGTEETETVFDELRFGEINAVQGGSKGSDDNGPRSFQTANNVLSHVVINILFESLLCLFNVRECVWTSFIGAGGSILLLPIVMLTISIGGNVFLDDQFESRATILRDLNLVLVGFCPIGDLLNS
jgi:hypothetical protein